MTIDQINTETRFNHAALHEQQSNHEIDEEMSIAMCHGGRAVERSRSKDGWTVQNGKKIAASAGCAGCGIC